MDRRAVVVGVPLAVALAVGGWRMGAASADDAIDHGAGPLAVLAMPYYATASYALAIGLVAALARRESWATAMVAWTVATPINGALAYVAASSDSKTNLVRDLLESVAGAFLFTALPAAVFAAGGSLARIGISRIRRRKRQTECPPGGYGHESRVSRRTAVPPREGRPPS